MSDIGGGGAAAPAASGSGGVSSGGGSPSTGNTGKQASAIGAGATAAVAARAGQAQAKAPAQPQQAAGAEGAGDTGELTAAEKRQLLKLEVDGEEIEYDYSDTEKLKRDLQRRFGAEKRMAEAAKLRKQTEAFIESLKADPITAMQRLGLDPRQISEGYLKKQIEAEMLREQDPARWQLEQERQKLEADRAEVEKIKEAEKQRQFEVAKQHAAASLEKKFMTALEIGGIPKTPYTVKRMAELQKQARANGYDLDPAELAEVVRNDLSGDLKATLGGMDAGALLKFLGDDVVAKLREADLARFQRPTTPPVQGRAAGSKPAPAKKMTMQEFLARRG